MAIGLSSNWSGNDASSQDKELKCKTYFINYEMHYWYFASIFTDFSNITP